MIPRRMLLPDSAPLFSSTGGPSKYNQFHLYLPWFIVGLLSIILFFTRLQPSHRSLLTNVPNCRKDIGLPASQQNAPGELFVSYSYFEKDVIQNPVLQKANFEFFILSAMGIGSTRDRDAATHYFIVVSGEKCGPCNALDHILGPRVKTAEVHGISWVREGPGVTLLQRSENQGMDFAAHNGSMTYAMSQAPRKWAGYKHFVFLNSSVKGPFTPKYYPFHWSQPYLSLMKGKVKAVGSSLVCLPSVDAGGPGPRVESWAFAMDQVGLGVVIGSGVFRERTCKLCTGKDGIVVGGEYGLTTALLDAGYSVDTLMYKYRDIDWRDRRNWNCNNQVHPSRHGTYDGISMHPFETVFLKKSWHVGEPFVDKYSLWDSTAMRGGDAAAGVFDEPMYRYAITLEAQDKHPLIEKAYHVGPWA